MDDQQKNTNKLLVNLEDKIKDLAHQMEKSKLEEYVGLLGHPWRLLWINFISGVAKGVGIMLGFAIFGAILVIILQKLVPLNIPIIGEFIAEIVEIVQKQLKY